MVNTVKRAVVFGANGNTGRQLVEQLINKGISVTAVARSQPQVSEDIKSSNLFHFFQASVSELSDKEWLSLLTNADYVLSTLGHNLSVKGVWGQPRMLVSDTLKRACETIEKLQPETPVKVILMASTGCVNHLLLEKPPLSQRIAVSLIRNLIPPHLDNETAVNYLAQNVSDEHPYIKWSIVRPDGLIDVDYVSEYEFSDSPVRNVIFDAGKTSRINVGNVMARLADEDALWQQWQGQMPVIYNTKDGELL